MPLAMQKSGPSIYPKRVDNRKQMTARGSQPCIHANLGMMDYRSCLELQHRVRELRQKDDVPDCMLIVEHPPVFTIGRSGSRENLLVDETFLNEHRISCIDIERGGDITYHGPGQLVAYPIFKLKGTVYGVADFINELEEVMLKILQESGIRAERNEKNRGVWVGESKIGFVGIAVRGGVTSHGLALNVRTDLEYFSMINPCGLTRTPVISMQRFVTADISMTEVANRLSFITGKTFDHTPVLMGTDSLYAFLEKINS